MTTPVDALPPDVLLPRSLLSRQFLRLFHNLGLDFILFLSQRIQRILVNIALRLDLLHQGNGLVQLRPAVPLYGCSVPA